MSHSIAFAGETRSNAVRQIVAQSEPAALRTYTPSQAVFAKSAGVFHWTPEGRRLYDYSSGVLVANLGHNPKRWLQNFGKYMGWSAEIFAGTTAGADEYVPAVTMTAYNRPEVVDTCVVVDALSEEDWANAVLATALPPFKATTMFLAAVRMSSRLAMARTSRLERNDNVSAQAAKMSHWRYWIGL